MTNEILNTSVWTIGCFKLKCKQCTLWWVRLGYAQTDHNEMMGSNSSVERRWFKTSSICIRSSGRDQTICSANLQSSVGYQSVRGDVLLTFSWKDVSYWSLWFQHCPRWSYANCKCEYRGSYKMLMKRLGITIEQCLTFSQHACMRLLKPGSLVRDLWRDLD